MDGHAITLSQAIEGYFIAARARRLSPHTLADYGGTFSKFCEFLETDFRLQDITADYVRAFLDSQGHLAAKTVLNLHTGLSALWTWALKEHLVERHIVRDVDPPKPELREIIPITTR